MLKGAAAGTAALGLAAVGSPWSAPVPASTSPAPLPTPEPAVASPPAMTDAAASPVASGLVGYAFNAKTQDVTLFDPATRRVIATEPLGAVVRWLSNEQRFWDGRHVWTYDFPDDEVIAIAIDPRDVGVARTLPTGGRGPAHSLMLTPDLKEAWVNVAGADLLAVFDVASGQVVARIETGAYP